MLKILDFLFVIARTVSNSEFEEYIREKEREPGNEVDDDAAWIFESALGGPIFEREPGGRVIPKITPEGLLRLRKAPVELAKSNPGALTRYLRQSTQDLFEMFHARTVDRFETYLVSMIRAVLCKQPKILNKSEYTVDMKTIIAHRSIDSLAYDLIERKVSSLSYDGFEILQSWCGEHGIRLTVPAGKQDQVIELIATRNIIVHNRGVVDQKYREIVKDARFELGEHRILRVGDFFGAIELLRDIVETTDRAVANDFGLDMVPPRAPDISFRLTFDDGESV